MSSTDTDLIATTSDDTLLASVVDDDATTVTPVDVAALSGWRLLDVVWRGPGHPARWFVAVDGTRSLVLSGHPERWTEITDGARVTTSDEALELAAVHADATRDMSRGYQRLSSIDDIRLRPRLSEEQQGLVDRVRRDLGDRVAPASAVGDGPWQVTLWVRVDGSLERREVEVAGDGTTTVTSVVAAEGLPVPIAR